MKFQFGFLLLLMFATQLTFAQKYGTKTGHINFHSDAKMETIKANNYKTAAVIDAATGAMEFSLLMKGFEFEKSLMQDHFNENYVESDKYPKSTFKGKIADISKVKFGTNGTYPVSVTGKLTIHGVTKDVTAKGNVVVSGGKVSANSVFNISLSDYGVKISADKVSNISNTIKISVNLKELKAM
ncbi:MAG: YceI family protein [Bacteroidia bacterium]